LVGLWWGRRRIGKGPLAAMLHFYVCTSLLILLVVLYMTRFSFVADHWQYFGCMSVVALAAAGITAALGWLENGRTFLKPVFCGLLLLVLGALTWQQAGIYRNLETLWRDTLVKNPDCWMAHDMLGNLLRNQGHIEEAMEHYHEAIRINPNYSEALNNLGAALAAEGRVDEAIENFRKAIQMDPNNFEALNNLGAALANKGQLDEVIENFRKAIQINPNFSEALNNLGIALAAKGQFDEAIKNYRKAIQSDPNNAEALNNLAWVLAAGPDDNLRDGFEAVRLAERACELTHYGQPSFIGTLSAAYAESGRFPEAVSTAEKAEQLATRGGLTAVAAKNRQLLEFYRAGKPYRPAQQ
jgi:Tfp pilus assembly protein PilF